MKFDITDIPYHQKKYPHKITFPCNDEQLEKLNKNENKSEIIRMLIDLHLWKHQEN